MHPLEPYVQAWHGTAHDVIDLLPSLADDDWSKPTDLPGWSVHDVAAHLAHLEAVLADRDNDPPPSSGDGRSPSTDYTQAGVDARADRSPQELIDELRECVEARTEQLRDLPDPSSKPGTTPGGVDWTWEVLMRNRAIDLWCHEQDIRRAVGRPGIARHRGRPGHHALLRGRHAVRAGQADQAACRHVGGVAPHRRRAAWRSAPSSATTVAPRHRWPMTRPPP